VGHAQFPPRAGVHVAIKCINNAVTSASFAATTKHTIVDYGCNEGSNSLLSIQAFVDEIRKSAQSSGGDSKDAKASEITVVCVDQTSNEWSQLFTNFSHIARPNVFVLANGSNYFTQVLPSSTVHFGFSSSASHFLSRRPLLLTDHIYANLTQSNEEKQAFIRQSKTDWSHFLKLRSQELVPGGTLVVLSHVSAGDADALDKLAIPLNTILRKMVDEGILTRDELHRCTMTSRVRSKEEMEDAASIKDAGLVLLTSNLTSAHNPIFLNFESHKDKQKCLKDVSSFLRAVSYNILSHAFVNPNKNAKIEQVFERFEKMHSEDPQILAVKLNYLHQVFQKPSK